MADFVPSKKEASDFNEGVQYIDNDIVQPSTINDLVESALYSQGVVRQNTLDIQNGISELNNEFDYFKNTVNTRISSFEEGVNQDIESITATANAANSKVDNFIASTDAPPPPVGYHYIQFSGESNPGTRWAGTQWTIDTTYNKRTIIGSGGSYTLGATGGSEDAVIVKHYHKLAQGVPVGTSSSGDKYRLAGIMSSSISVQMQDIMGSGYESGTANGVDGTGKNMQPYKVVNIWKRTA